MASGAVSAEPARDGTNRRPFWTEADQAEWELLAWALVDGSFEHREQCATCTAGYPPCPHIAKAIQIVLDWHRGRELLALARRDLVEFKRDLAAFRRGEW